MEESLQPYRPGFPVEMNHDDSQIKAPQSSRRRLRELHQWLESRPDKLLEAFPSLSFAEQLSILLLSSGQLRQALILASPFSAKLVAMLPEQEVYLTLKEIGLEDATPLLSLMNRVQIQYVNDLETWRKERFQPPDLLKLLKIVHQCGEDKFAEWLETLDPELLVLLLQHYGRVSKFDITKDPVEATDEPYSITFDGYYRYHPFQQEMGAALSPVLRILQARNPRRYGMIMESTYADQRAEVEDEALRYRSGRLAEQGIPGFDEACEIYRYLSEEQFHRYVWETSTAIHPRSTAPALYPVRLLPSESFLRKALVALGDHPETDRIRMELASLGNKVLIADGLEVTTVDLLRYALEKVTGFLTLGLEILAGRNVEEAAQWLARTWLHYIFRLGYGRVHRLALEARRARDRMGFRWIDRFHSLLDSPLEETLWGLCRQRPLFYEGRSEENYLGFRDFRGLDDLRTVAAHLRAAEVLAGFFEEDLRLPPEEIKRRCLEAGLGDRLDAVKWSQVFHTVSAIEAVSGPGPFRPLTQEEVRRFLRGAFLGRPGTADRRLDPAYVESLVQRLREAVSEPGEEAWKILEEWLRAGAARLEDELKHLDPGRHVDGRFVQALCVG